MENLLDYLSGVKMTFDHRRCNHAFSHMKDGVLQTINLAEIDCPHCLRHRIGELERIVERLTEGAKGEEAGKARKP